MTDGSSSTLELVYRPDAEQVISRQREWFDMNNGRKYLVSIIPGPWNVFNWDLSIGVKTRRALKKYNFNREEDLIDYLDFRMEQITEHWERKLSWSLDDDMLPVFEPRLGWAEGPATCIDADVVYYGQTSNLKSVIESYDTFDWHRIHFNPESEAAQVLQRMNKYSLEQGKGRFLIQPRGETVNPSDLAKACRGDVLFTDFVDYPDEVKRLLELCLQSVIDLIKWVRIPVGQTCGGTVSAWLGGHWTPDRILGHVGDNVSDLISADTYVEFIQPITKALAGHFGGMIFGRDITSRQVWGSLPKVGNVTAFQPRPMGSVDVTTADIIEIVKKTDRIPLFLMANNFNTFKEYANTVKEQGGLKVFFVVHCASRDEGQRVLDIVRSME